MGRPACVHAPYGSNSNPSVVAGNKNKDQRIISQISSGTCQIIQFKTDAIHLFICWETIRPRNFPLNLTVKFLLKFALKNEETGKMGGNGGTWGKMGGNGAKRGKEGGGWWGKYAVDPKGVANLCTLRKISECWSINMMVTGMVHVLLEMAWSQHMQHRNQRNLRASAACSRPRIVCTMRTSVCGHSCSSAMGKTRPDQPKKAGGKTTHCTIGQHTRT